MYGYGSGDVNRDTDSEMNMDRDTEVGADTDMDRDARYGYGHGYTYGYGLRYGYGHIMNPEPTGRRPGRHAYMIQGSGSGPPCRELGPASFPPREREMEREREYAAINPSVST